MSNTPKSPVTTHDVLRCLKNGEHGAVLAWMESNEEHGFSSEVVEQVCGSGSIVLAHRVFQRHTGAMKEEYLCAAAKVGSVATLKLLLPRSTDTMVARAMQTAVEHGQMGCVKFLVGTGAGLKNTLLAIAAKHNKPQMVAFLLNHCDPTHRFSEALCVACERDNRRIVDLLLPVSNVEEAGVFLERKVPRHRNACTQEVIAQGESLRQRNLLMAHIDAPSTVVKRKM